MGDTATSYEYEILNLGNSRTIVLNEFIKSIEDILGEKAKIEFLPDQPGDVKTALANIDEAKQKIRHKPLASLRKGLTEMIEWYYAQASFIESQKGA